VSIQLALPHEFALASALHALKPTQFWITALRLAHRRISAQKVALLLICELKFSGYFGYLFAGDQ